MATVLLDLFVVPSNSLVTANEFISLQSFSHGTAKFHENMYTTDVLQNYFNKQYSLPNA